MMMRVWFEKTGKLKFISHLDLNRTMLRAVSRSRLPLWYTQGFNKHPFITFALPLSLGVESRCEIMDIRLEDGAVVTPEEVKEKLNQVLPPELKVFRVAEVAGKVSQIAFAAYDLDFPGDAQKIRHRFDEFWARPQIMVFKKTKSGGKEVDLKELVELKDIQVLPDRLRLKVVLPAGNEESLNPSVLTSAFIEYANDDQIGVLITRTAILNQNRQDFF